MVPILFVLLFSISTNAQIVQSPSKLLSSIHSAASQGKPFVAEGPGVVLRGNEGYVDLFYNKFPFIGGLPVIDYPLPLRGTEEEIYEEVGRNLNLKLEYAEPIPPNAANPVPLQVPGQVPQQYYPNPVTQAKQYPVQYGQRGQINPFVYNDPGQWFPFGTGLYPGHVWPFPTGNRYAADSTPARLVPFGRGYGVQQATTNFKPNVRYYNLRNNDPNAPPYPFTSRRNRRKRQATERQATIPAEVWAKLSPEIQGIYGRNNPASIGQQQQYNPRQYWPGAGLNYPYGYHPLVDAKLLPIRQAQLLPLQLPEWARQSAVQGDRPLVPLVQLPLVPRGVPIYPINYFPSFPDEKLLYNRGYLPIQYRPYAVPIDNLKVAQQVNRPFTEPFNPQNQLPFGSKAPFRTSNIQGFTSGLTNPSTAGLTNPLTSGLTNPLTSGLTNPLTSGLTNPLTSGLTNPLTSGLTNPLTSGLTNPLTSGLTNPLTSGLTNPLTSGLTNPLTSGLTNPFTGTGFTNPLRRNW